MDTAQGRHWPETSGMSNNPTSFAASGVPCSLALQPVGGKGHGEQNRKACSPHPRQYERNGGRREEAEELGQGCKWEEDSYAERGIEGTESGIISGEKRGTNEIGSSTTHSHRPPNLQPTKTMVSEP